MDEVLSNYIEAYKVLDNRKTIIIEEMETLSGLIKNRGGEIPIPITSVQRAIPVSSKNLSPSGIVVRALGKSYEEASNWDERIIHATHTINYPKAHEDIAVYIKGLNSPTTPAGIDKSVQLGTARLAKEGILGRKKDGKKYLYYLIR